ncbi:MAG: hypothetical protein HYY25_01065 [Candidatus Wallbacteria bacterium]|nr:hypothetical protein [Candidatus Wallbacteria bacterium]
MKFTCDGKLLAQVLAKMVKLATRKASASAGAELLQLVASAAGLVRLTVAHGGTKLTAGVPAIVDSPGLSGVSATALTELCRAMAPLGLPVQCEVSEMDRQMRIASGPVEQVLETMAAEEAVSPDSDDGEELETVRVPGRCLKLALDRLAPILAAMGQPGAPDAVACDVDADGRVMLAATDTTRLAMVGLEEAQVQSAAPLPQAWNLKSTDIQLLSALLNGDAAGAEGQLILKTTGWTATWSHYQFTSLYSERAFPNWRAIWPRAYTNTLEVDGKEFGAILRLLAKVADPKRAAVKFQWNGEREALLAAGNRDAGTETAVALGLEWKTRQAAPGSSLTMSAKLLEPIVKKLEAGPVLFSFTAPSQPARVRPADAAEAVEYLVMPINL